MNSTDNEHLDAATVHALRLAAAELATLGPTLRLQAGTAGESDLAERFRKVGGAAEQMAAEVNGLASAYSQSVAANAGEVA